MLQEKKGTYLLCPRFWNQATNQKANDKRACFILMWW